MSDVENANTPSGPSRATTGRVALAAAAPARLISSAGPLETPTQTQTQARILPSNVSSARIFKLPPGFVLVRSANGTLVARPQRTLLKATPVTANAANPSPTAVVHSAPKTQQIVSVDLEQTSPVSPAPTTPRPASARIVSLKAAPSGGPAQSSATTPASEPRVITVKNSQAPLGGGPLKSPVTVPAITVSKLHEILARKAAASSGGNPLNSSQLRSEPRIITLKAVLAQKSDPQPRIQSQKPVVLPSESKGSASAKKSGSGDAEAPEAVAQTEEAKSKEGTKKKPQAWCREPRPLWKGPDPVVLYSGAPPENLEPKKKKELPPESLPCPKKLDDILPKAFSYHIASFEELKSPDDFKAEVRANIFKKEDALQWLRDFEDISGTNFRVSKTFKENSSRLIFKKGYKCHKNTHRKDQVVKRESPRHVGCQARILITIKNSTMKSSADLLLHVYPCVISIYHNHCHILTMPDSLRYRRPLPEVREAFADMFRSKITPATARRLHMAAMKRQYGDKFPDVVHDGARCPPLPWCYRLYYETCGKKVKDGKKKSTRKSYYKRKVPQQSASAQVFQEGAPVMIEFNSGDEQNTHSIDVISKPACDEMQRSINSLYDYEFMSNNDKSGELVETVMMVDNDEGDVNNSDIMRLHHSAETEEDYRDDDFLDNEENVSDYEDNVENLDHSEGQVNEQFLERSSELGSNNCDNEPFSITEKNRICQDLQHTFEDIQARLESHPELYLPVVRKFLTACKNAQQTESNLGVISALDEFGADLPRVMATRPPAIKREVSDIIQDLAPQNKLQTSVSPKRKVLVLRMNPNKFNQIMGKVEASVPNKEMINI